MRRNPGRRDAQAHARTTNNTARGGGRQPARRRNRVNGVTRAQAHRLPFVGGGPQGGDDHCSLPRTQKLRSLTLAQHARPPRLWISEYSREGAARRRGRKNIDREQPSDVTPMTTSRKLDATPRRLCPQSALPGIRRGSAAAAGTQNRATSGVARGGGVVAQNTNGCARGGGEGPRGLSPSVLRARRAHRRAELSSGATVVELGSPVAKVTSR